MEPTDNLDFVLSGISLKRLLEPEKLIITPKDSLRAIQGPDQLIAHATKYVLGESLSVNDPSVSLKEAEAISEQLSDVTGDILLGTMINNLSDQGLDGLSISQGVSNLLSIAQARLPSNSFETADLPSSRSQIAKFAWVLRVVDNPSWVFNLMANQQLTDIDVSTLQAAYPIWYEFAVSTLIQLTIEKQVPLTRSRKMMLSVLLQSPVITPEVLAAYTVPEPKDAANPDINISKTGA